MSLETLRILLADDNLHMRAIVMTLLQSCGAKHIREASNGADALAHLQHWPCDMAIVDFKMEPVNGVEFTRRVRQGADTRNAYLPIIMMSGHSARARVEEARDAGVNEFIVKPITAKTLLHRIYTLIEKPRPFVHAGDYFGPDRRRRTNTTYAGPARREGERVAMDVSPEANPSLR